MFLVFEIIASAVISLVLAIIFLPYINFKKRIK